MPWPSQEKKSFRKDPNVDRRTPDIPLHKLEVEWYRGDRILIGYEEMATYLRCSLSSIRRYVRNAGLPAMQRPDGTYLTSTNLIDEWILAVSHVQAEQRKAKAGGGDEGKEPAAEPTW